MNFSRVILQLRRCIYDTLSLLLFKNISNLGKINGTDINYDKDGNGIHEDHGTCTVGGQAVGTAAALCVDMTVDPRRAGNHIEGITADAVEGMTTMFPASGTGSEGSGRKIKSQ